MDLGFLFPLLSLHVEYVVEAGKFAPKIHPKVFFHHFGAASIILHSGEEGKKDQIDQGILAGKKIWWPSG